MSYSEAEYHRLEEEITSLRVEAELTQARTLRLLDHLAVCDVPTTAPVGQGYCLAPGGSVRCHHFFRQLPLPPVTPGEQAPA